MWINAYIYLGFFNILFLSYFIKYYRSLDVKCPPHIKWSVADSALTTCVVCGAGEIMGCGILF